MGMDFRAIIAIGMKFDERQEVIDFLEQHNLLNDEDRQAIEDEGLEEWLYNNDKVEGQCLNLYSGYPFFVGYEISCRSPESFRKSYEDGMEKWDKYFPDQEPSMIKTVKVY